MEILSQLKALVRRWKRLFYAIILLPFELIGSDFIVKLVRFVMMKLRVGSFYVFVIRSLLYEVDQA